MNLQDTIRLEKGVGARREWGDVISAGIDGNRAGRYMSLTSDGWGI